MTQSKYLLLSLLAIMCFVSCFPEDINPNDGKEDYYEGDVLKFSVTLDNMGGVNTKAFSISTESRLQRMENYVDPEKFRVLVFNGKDEFLFESKSRWVKQLNPTPENLEWSVAIPVYSYGNDMEYEELWDEIRNQLTSDDLVSFKIAILANRPEVDRFPEMAGNDQSSMNKDTDFDNSGPHWGKKNSAAYKGDGADVKTVFDLHHSQYDPIYEYKGSDKFKTYTLQNVYYNIMGKDSVLSSTSSWVQFDAENQTGRYVEKGKTTETDIDATNYLQFSNLSKENYEKGPQFDVTRDPRGWNFRKTRLPDESYPIPMYGIQRFKTLSGWKKGTTVSLNRKEDSGVFDKPISLLRSVVKLELIIPEEYAPTDVVLFYSNIYARCEPMDVWTPTDSIWADANGLHNKKVVCDEMAAIQNLGLMTALGDGTNMLNDNSREGYVASAKFYKEKLALLYGRWWEAYKWGRTGDERVYDTEIQNALNTYFTSNKDKLNRVFPRIFNPCIQRNNSVYVEKTYTDGKGAHYVVYTGERNINDPSDLSRVGNTASGNPTILYWCIIYDVEKNTSFLGDGGNSITYSFPIVDYNTADAAHVSREGRIVQSTKATGSASDQFFFKPANSERAEGAYNTNAPNNTAANGTGMGEYLMRVQGQKVGTYTEGNGDPYSSDDWPLPLIRNHVYKLTLTTATKSGGDGLSFTPRLEDMYTPDICFKK